MLRLLLVGKNYSTQFTTQFLTNPIFNYHNISASAGVKYNLSDQSYIIGSYALASRPPNPSELFSDGLHHSAARFELGNLRFDILSLIFLSFCI